MLVSAYLTPLLLDHKNSSKLSNVSNFIGQWNSNIWGELIWSYLLKIQLEQHYLTSIESSTLLRPHNKEIAHYKLYTALKGTLKMQSPAWITFEANNDLTRITLVSVFDNKEKTHCYRQTRHPLVANEIDYSHNLSINKLLAYECIPNNQMTQQDKMK